MRIVLLQHDATALPPQSPLANRASSYVKPFLDRRCALMNRSSAMAVLARLPITGIQTPAGPARSESGSR